MSEGVGASPLVAVLIIVALVFLVICCALAYGAMAPRRRRLVSSDVYVNTKYGPVAIDDEAQFSDSDSLFDELREAEKYMD